MGRLLTILILLLAIFSGWNKWKTRVSPVISDNMLAPGQPVQRKLSRGPVFERDNYRIQAVASYTVQARLLRRENYRFDREADLSPVDFALGWGPMSANPLLDQLTITQNNRFYWLRWQDQSISSNLVMHNSANTHIIPANRSVAKDVAAMRPGQIIELEGYLVNVNTADGWRWNTSLSRTDTGAGACELFWVENARVIQH